MHRLRYLTAALAAAAALVSSAPAAAQDPAAVLPVPGEATFLVFLGGQEVGREQISLARSAAGWTITATGSLGPPMNLTTRSFTLTYANDWQPIELRIEAEVQNRAMTLATSFGTTTALNEITQDGVTNTKTDQITARAVVLPNNFYAAFEGLAVRLAPLGEGAELPVYIAPQAEIRMSVRAVTPATYQTPAGTISARRYSVTFHNPDTPVDAEITVDDRHRFARLEVAGGVLSVAREDLVGVGTRQETFRNPTDTDVRIPAAGFSLAGTVTMPPGATPQGRVRHPAILLIGGSGPVDRDGTVAGIPLHAQLAGQLAEEGYIVLRYDKRGVGQSGGRVETVTLQDYADDALAAVRFLSRRRDVDNRRIFVVGHSEGASVAMLAGRERRIAGLVLMGGIGTTGRDLILEQQRYMLDVTRIVDAERAEKIELQERILDAAIEQEGWEDLPAEVRPLVDTPWYRSLLLFDAAAVMPRVRQPVLVIHGELDRQVPPHHAERLAELAKARRNAPPVALETLPGLNHLLVPARTGHVAEYASLEAQAISPQVASTIAGWLRTLRR
jgi:alpha-beta hydrolase superfamily lysophospholipase